MRTEDLWEETVHSYLLGKLTEEEAARFEAEVFDDEASYARFQAAQDDLFDAYARGALSPADRDQFERHALASPFLRRRAAFAESLRDAVLRPDSRRAEAASEPATGWLTKLKAALRTNAYGFRPLAAAALLLLLAGSGWLLWETIRLRREAAQTQARLNEQARQSAQDRQRATQLSEALQQEQARRAQLESELAARPTPSSDPGSTTAGILSFILAPAGFRNGGDSLRLIVPRQVRTIRLQLRFAGTASGREYRVEIETPDERKVWERAGLRAAPSPGGLQVTAAVPASALPDSDYFVKLKARTADGEQELAGYPLRLVRK